MVSTLRRGSGHRRGRGAGTRLRAALSLAALLAAALLAAPTAVRAAGPGDPPHPAIPADGAPQAGGGATLPSPSLDELERRIASGPSLPELSAYALLASPMVRAERARWRVAVERYRVDTAWSNPEVMAEGMYMTEGFGDRVAPDDWLLRLTQDVPLPGRTGAAGRVAEADARIGRLRTDQAARDAVLSVRESFFELSYLREAKRIASLNGELLERMERAGEGAYGAGRAVLVDVMKAQAQAGQLRYDALLLDELERTETARLNGILGRPPDAAVGPLAETAAAPLAYDLAEIRAFADNGYEEVRIAREGAAKAGAMVELARYENLPELNVGISGGKQDGASQVGLQVGVMLPVWAGKNGGRTAGAAADLEAMRAMEQGTLNEARSAVSAAFYRHRNAERLVALYRDDLLPRASRAVATAEALFRQGEGSFSDYLETRAALHSFQLSLARAKADLGKARARLEAFAGRDLSVRKGKP